MNVQTEKLELIELLIGINDMNLLKNLKQFIKSKQSDNTEINISTQLRSSIKKGLQQIENKEYKNHTEVRKLYEKWL